MTEDCDTKIYIQGFSTDNGKYHYQRVRVKSTIGDGKEQPWKYSINEVPVTDFFSRLFLSILFFIKGP